MLLQIKRKMKAFCKIKRKEDWRGGEGGWEPVLISGAQLPL